MAEMISVEEARELVLSHMTVMDSEVVPVLESVGRAAAADLVSDMDVSPFAHSAMDGFALRAEQIASASEETPVELDVIAEIPAGSTYEGPIEDGQCVRIMTGAPLPDMADSVVKYEIVGVVTGDGKPGSRVSFTAPTSVGSNVRAAGEEAREGEVIVHTGDIINPAGVGFLAGCGVMEAPVYKRPRVAVISIGSELVNPPAKPGPGQIRNSNAFAMAACVHEAGGIADIYPIVEDTQEALAAVVKEAAQSHDFVLTTGGASNGDFDFIKPVVDSLGTLLMTTVNMRPGKAQTFGLVDGIPVFGLPGNPAAAYMGFHVLIRPALRKMQGFSHYELPVIKAKLASDLRKKDSRRIYTRAVLTKNEQGELIAAPSKNQSSGLFGPLQKSNCVIVLPEGLESKVAGDEVDCVLLDVSEETVI